MLSAVRTCLLHPEPINFALVLHQLFSSKFRCTSIRKGTWQVLKDGVWHDIEEGYVLYKHIHSTLLPMLQSELETLTGEECVTASHSIKLLTKVPFKSNVMKEAAVLFYGEEGGLSL